MRRLLASRWITPLVVAVALALTVRSLTNGLEADDYYHRAVLTGSSRFDDQMRGPQAMMRFAPGDPDHAMALIDAGLFPWWTDPAVKAEFLQLVPTQTHILDYWLWPERPALMHAHNMLWYALLVFLVTCWYRQTLGPTCVAGLAALMFAIDDAHGTPVGWICNRNILIAASFGVGCLMVHAKWRECARGWALGLALLLWVGSLLSKEAGIATCAYLFAYAVWLDRSSPWRRFLTLVPYGVVLVVWRIVRDALGYGVENIGFYVDPITEPARYAWALVERYPVVLFGQWGMLSDLAAFFERLFASPLWWIALVYVSAVGLLLGPLVRTDRVARFFATGMLLAVVPVCTTAPMDRLLVFVGLGAFGSLAQFLAAVFGGEQDAPRWTMSRRAVVPFAVLLVLLHLVVAPALLVFRAIPPTGPRWLSEQLYVRTPFGEEIREQDLVLVNPPSSMHSGYSLLLYEHDQSPVPRTVRTLTSGIFSVTLRRIDQHTLEVEPARGFFAFFPDRLFRNQQNALAAGEEVRLTGMTATVLELNAAGRPAAVRFRFAAPLEDASLRWLRFESGEFVPWTPPAVGEEETLEIDWP